jgi:hypothetical protein
MGLKYAVVVTYALATAPLCFAAGPSLSALRRVGDLTEFTLIGETNTQYRIQASTNLQNWFPVATNADVAEPRQITVPAFESQCFYRAEARVPRFQFAIAAGDTISLNGNDIVIDSFDSEDPLFSTLGQYDPLKRTDDAIVGAPSADIGNASIYGRGSTTTEGQFTIGPNGAVGDASWHFGAGSGIQPGAIRDDLDLVLPDLVAPYTVGMLPMGGTYPNVGGTVYDYKVGNGDFIINQLNMNNQKMIVTGVANLVLISTFTNSSSSYIEIAPGASLRLYVAAPTALIGGNGILNHNPASAFVYYGLPSNTNVTISANGSLTGCIYAPNADVTINSATNRFALVGSIVARSVTLTGQVEFHYDDALQRTGAFTW